MHRWSVKHRAFFVLAGVVRAQFRCGLRGRGHDRERRSRRRTVGVPQAPQRPAVAPARRRCIHRARWEGSREARLCKRMKRRAHHGVRVQSGMFDRQPVLRSDVLELRPLRLEDFHDLYAVASDPLIWEQHPVRDRYQEEVFKDFFREALESGGALIAIDRNTRRVIGSSRFHGYDEEKSEIEIGWTFLARSHWGGAFNREMKKLMLGHAFRFVKSVIFVVGAQNLRSQRAVEKIGGVRVGSRLDANGRDSFLYQITASKFMQDNQGLSSR